MKLDPAEVFAYFERADAKRANERRCGTCAHLVAEPARSGGGSCYQREHRLVVSTHSHRNCALWQLKECPNG